MPYRRHEVDPALRAVDNFIAPCEKCHGTLKSHDAVIQRDDEMIFIVLGKFRKKATKETAAATDKLLSQLQIQGVKVVGFYWTLGRYDSVTIFDGPDSGAIERAMKGAMAVSENVATETLVALKREDAIRLLD